MDMLKGKRTALVALAIMVVGALQAFDFTTIFSDPTQAGWVVTGLGVVMFVLRAITDTSMFENK